MALLVGLLLVPLMLGMGLVLDGGLLLFEHRSARNAADAGALAAAKKVHAGEDTIAVLSPNPRSCATPPSPARPAFDAACAIAENHGYGLSEISVAIPALAIHQVESALNQVEVIINRPYNTMLMGLVGITQVPIGALAVAGERIVAPGAGIYALDPDACAGLDRTSSGGLYVFGGPIVVDSSAGTGCAPAGGALNKASTGIICVDASAGDYVPDPSAPVWGYGCDGKGSINVVGGVDCPDPDCATLKSEPDLVVGRGGGGYSGDPLAPLPGPAHAAATDLDDDPAYAGPLHGHAFTFCNNDSLGPIDSARLNWPLSNDSRSNTGLRSSVGGDCSGKVLETAFEGEPILTWDAASPERFDVCAAPDDEPLSPGVNQMRPGIYWGGIYNSVGCTVHFRAGIYIMAGQPAMGPIPRPSINLNWPASGGTVWGNDLLFFVTSDPAAMLNEQKPSGPMLFQTATTMTLSATQVTPANCPPTAPNYEGVLLFVSRAADRRESTGATGSNIVTIHGGGDSMTLRGIWYDPNGELQAEGSFRLLDTMLIFNVLDMQMEGDVIITLSACGGASNRLFLLR